MATTIHGVQENVTHIAALLNGLETKDSLVSGALEEEISRATAGENTALTSAKAYADSLALSTQQWLPSVATKSLLPTSPGTGTYLCRVREGSDQGVYQWIGPSGPWTSFSENQDFIDKISSPTVGNIPTITSDGELIDGGFSKATISGWINAVAQDSSTDISQLEADIAAVSGALETEKTRATAAESGLADKDAAISGAVTAETTRATTKENAISGALDTEKTRATAREDAISGAVETEKARALAAESTLTTGLAAEITRATGKENTISGALATLIQQLNDVSGIYNS
jgi:hypothetical protein